MTWSYREVRDAVITTVALGVLVQQAISANPNALIIGLIGSLLALPAFLRVDEHLRRRNGDNADDEKADA